MSIISRLRNAFMHYAESLVQVNSAGHILVAHGYDPLAVSGCGGLSAVEGRLAPAEGIAGEE